MFIYLIFVPVLLALWHYVYRRLWPRGLTARMTFSAGPVCAGEEAEVTEVIANRKKLPVPELEVGFRIEKGVEFPGSDNIVTSDYVYKRDIFSLRPMEEVTRRYALSCVKRGRYHISQISVKAWSVFHDVEYEIESVGEDELLVYAGRTNVSALTASIDALLGSREAERRFMEDPFSFASIREYTPADPMKTVNWKATARTGSLMVNTYASVKSEKFFIFLDVTDDGILLQEDLVEEGIRAAASLIRTLVREGRETGLAVNSAPPAVFLPKRGAEQLSLIERFLTADFHKEGTSDFTQLTAGTAPGRDWICVVISKELRRDPVYGLMQFRRAGQTVLAVCPVREEGGVRLRVL